MSAREPSNPPSMVLVTIGVFLLMVLVDYLTGRDLVISAAYLVPVCFCAWHLGSASVWLMSAAVGCATLVMGIVEGHLYSHVMFHYWNSVSCFVIAVVVGLLLRRLKRTLDDRRKANEELRKAFETLSASTEEIRRLQGELQIVCAWTKQVKVDGQWMTPEEFLSTRLHLNLTHGMSPEAYDKVMCEISAVVPAAAAG